MKNPNGYGSCYLLPGSRRKPWCVRITLGKEGGIYKYKYLGYFETYTEGLIALAEYNRDPYDLDARKATFSELYKLWCEHNPSRPKSSLYVSAYKALSSLHECQFATIRPIDIQHAVDLSGSKLSVILQIRSLLSMMYKFAVANDFCSKDFSAAVDVSRYLDRKGCERAHEAFAEHEVSVLWDHSSERGCKIFLILIYTGLRIQELLKLKKEDVDLDRRILHVSKSKTAAGVRDVPISMKILPFVEELYCDSSSTYLVSSGRNSFYSYTGFKGSIWAPVTSRLGMHHSPHDARHTFVSLLTAAGIDQRLIGKIVGHAAGNVTVDVYTHFTDEQLLAAVDIL